ncbi:MAG TPA: outer membrane protein assembly factor BamD, partial [Candidatus Binataceae bacterium]|nr:outer membrane protein assembly factor BamD [Candidatus Binataceae bacterium]
MALIAGAFALVYASSCAIRQKPTGEDFYAQGQLDFADNEYKAAIENYQKLIDQYPFSPYAEDAELKIGLAHYQEGDYAEAVAALDDFQRMHPTNKDLDLVTYYIARSYYDQIGREDQ